MKANAPEKIYINGFSCFAEEPVKDSVEYIRADTFIEKVINFLNYKLDDVVATRVIGTIIPHHVAKQELIEDFKNYITEKKV